MSCKFKPEAQIVAESRVRYKRFEEITLPGLTAARFFELEQWYERFLEQRDLEAIDRDMLPHKYDWARLWWQSILMSRGFCDVYRPMDITVFGSTNGVLQHLQQYSSWVLRYLAEAMFQCIRDPRCHGQADKMVTRATAFFVCEACGEEGLSWSRMHGHWRRCHSDMPFFDTKKTWLDWHSKAPARYWQEGEKTVMRILSALGYGFGVPTTIAELDSLIKDGRLYCACGDPSLERPPELTWATLVSNVRNTGGQSD